MLSKLKKSEIVTAFWQKKWLFRH